MAINAIVVKPTGEEIAARRGKHSFRSAVFELIFRSIDPDKERLIRETNFVGAGLPARFGIRALIFFDETRADDPPLLTDEELAFIRNRRVEVIILPKDFAGMFGGCKNVRERLDMLMKVVPDIGFWGPMDARELVYRLQRRYGVDFGVCEFYSFEGGRQFCSQGGERTECLCAIPEAHCLFRDKEGEPKYPEFLGIRLLELSFALKGEN